MHPTACPKLLAVTIAGACSAGVLAPPAPAHGQTSAPAATAQTTSSIIPADRVLGRRMVWDRTRADVDRAQVNVSRRAVDGQKYGWGADPALANTARQPITYRDFAGMGGMAAVADEHVPLVKAAYLGVASTPASAVLRRQLRLADGVGLVIEFVEPDSPAHGAGVRPYDVLVRLNEQVIVNPEQLAVLVRTFDPGDEVALSLIREGEPVDVPVRVAEREMKPLTRVEGGELGADDLGPPMGLADVEVADFAAVPVSPPAHQAPRALPAPQPRPQRAAADPNVGVLYGDRTREIRADDLLLVKLMDVEGPGVSTLKRQLIDRKGTLQLPRLQQPVPVVGCTPVQLERTVRGMYRSLGVESGGMVDVFVCTPEEPAAAVIAPPKAPPKPLTPAKP